mmetsp:Transcript_25478/g.71249  ORF Transcript_25478/g.71249 Transcript_25478/m.71249 type:complete len:957 (+) Transcript_25478:296-3166(+)
MRLFGVRQGCAALIVVVCGVLAVYAKPEQIHLSVTSQPDQIIVYWITDDEPATSTVNWGRSKWHLNETTTSKSVERYRYKGLRMRSGYTSGYIHEVTLRDLPITDFPQTFYYQCGDENNGWSDIRSFRTRPGHPDVPVIIAANGDQDAGQTEKTECRSPSKCVEETKTVEVMAMMMQRSSGDNATDLFINVGDLSYADGYQPAWDDYGRIMDEFTSHVPMIAAVGNHEMENHATYDPWLYRWRHEEENNGDKFWFSLDYGPAHIIILSSEHETRRQWEWMEMDLEKASEPKKRAVVPWIVVVAHHPMYNGRRITMSESNREKIGELLTKYKVSLFLCGHCHNYERTKPMNKDGVTDFGDGSMELPYIHELFEPEAGDEDARTHHCNWNKCDSGGRQGNMWCNANEDNCDACGGEWCKYPEEDGSSEGLRDQKKKMEPVPGWGTIHMIIGMGGRRGDQCVPLDWTHGSPKSNRGSIYFNIDRSQLVMQYVDINHDVIDEFKICSRRFCKPAPQLESFPPLHAKSTPPIAEKEADWELKWGSWSQSQPAPARQEEDEEVVIDEVEEEDIEVEDEVEAELPDLLPQNASVVPQHWKKQKWFTGPWAGDKTDMEEGREGENGQPKENAGEPEEVPDVGKDTQEAGKEDDEHVPDYVESNPTVYDVLDCPVEISKIDLAEAHYENVSDLKANFALREEISKGCWMQARDEDEGGGIYSPADALTAPSTEDATPQEAEEGEATAVPQRLEEEVEEENLLKEEVEEENLLEEKVEEKMMIKEKEIASLISEGATASMLAPEKYEDTPVQTVYVTEQPSPEGNGASDDQWQSEATSYLTDPAFLIPACIALVLAGVVCVLLVVVVRSCHKRRLHREREVLAQQFMTASELATSRSMSTSLDASHLVGVFRQPQPFVKSMASTSAAVPFPKPSQPPRPDQPSKAMIDMPETGPGSRALVSVDGRV